MEGEVGVLQVVAGQHIPAIKKIQLLSADDWEVLVEEWLSYKKSSYFEIERLGGAGDQGRDVVGFVTEPQGNKYVWDNFQCKHYDHPLMPSDVWSEFAKVCYFTHLNEFPVPRKYYFVAPHGVGTSLSNLLRDPVKLKHALIKNWDVSCKEKITKLKMISLEGGLLAHIEKFDFTIFEKIVPLTLIEEHAQTRYHIARFGGGFPARPKAIAPPVNIADYELPYINKLLEAYSSDCDTNFTSVPNLVKKKYSNHLTRSREHFHQAEQLRNFSRDTLPPASFDKYKKEILSGTINISEEEHVSGFECVKEVEKEARRLSISSNALSLCSDGNDRVGVCHHLANDGNLTWLSDDNDE